MIQLMFLTSGLALQSAPPPALDNMWAITRKHDEEVRARNAEHDYFFVSTVEKGLSQTRFYIDRNTVQDVDAAGYGRAWVDWYEVVNHKRPVRLLHTKLLTEVNCSERIPQLRFVMAVTYGPDGSVHSARQDGPWIDVVPGSSMETQHRFICHDEPANAFYPVFNGNTPEKDALGYFQRQPH